MIVNQRLSGEKCAFGVLSLLYRINSFIRHQDQVQDSLTTISNRLEYDATNREFASHADTYKSNAFRSHQTSLKLDKSRGHPSARTSHPLQVF